MASANADYRRDSSSSLKKDGSGIPRVLELYSVWSTLVLQCSPESLSLSLMKDCNQCGKCCTKYGGGDLAATRQEIELWELFNPEIYQYVVGGEIWFDPETGAKLNRCPFLQNVVGADARTPDKFECSIYQNRPEDCRHYPSTIDEMSRDECEMLEAIDILRPVEAQKKLDLLMIDSRPPRSI